MIKIVSSLEQGLQLLRDSAEINPDGDNYPEFWVHCKESYNLSKGQVSKLMKVAEAFGDDVRFKQVAMRVLYTLASKGNPDIIEKAAKLAAKFKLTTSTLEGIMK